MFGAIIYIPVYVQFLLGKTATNSGFIMLPMIIAQITASTIAGQIISRTGKYKKLSIAGLGVAATGMLFLSFMGMAATDGELIRNTILMGIGLGVTFPVFVIAVQNAFPRSRLGVVTAAIQFTRSIGGLVGWRFSGSYGCDSRKRAWKPSGINLINGNPEAILDGNVMSSLSAAEVDAVRSAFYESIKNIFLISAIITYLAFLIAFFMHEIPLRKRMTQCRRTRL